MQGKVIIDIIYKEAIIKGGMAPSPTSTNILSILANLLCRNHSHYRQKKNDTFIWTTLQILHQLCKGILHVAWGRILNWLSRAEWERTRTENGNLQLQLRISLEKLNRFKAWVSHSGWQMKMEKDFWLLAPLTIHRKTVIFPRPFLMSLPPTPSGHLDRAPFISSSDAYIQQTFHK